MAFGKQLSYMPDWQTMVDNGKNFTINMVKYEIKTMAKSEMKNGKI